MSTEVRRPLSDHEVEARNLATVSAVLAPWNTHDVEGILRHYDPEIRWHDQAMETTRPGGTRQAARRLPRHTASQHHR